MSAVVARRDRRRVVGGSAVRLLIAACVVLGAVACGSAAPRERSIGTEPVGVPSTVDESDVEPSRAWVVTSASAILPADDWSAEEIWADGLEGRTLRQVVHASVGGSAVRVALSNRFGAEPLVVGAASVGVSAEAAGVGPELADGLAVPLTFDGSSSVAVEPGEVVYSDDIELAVPADHDLAVNLFVTGPTGVPNGSRYSGQTSWSGPGDLTADGPGGGFDQSRASLAYVSAVEVLAEEPEGAVVVLGDSKSDGGLAVPADTEARWSDFLYDRLTVAGRPGLSVANVSFVGSAVQPADSEVSALGRLDHDVLGHAGLRTVIIALGTNDLHLRSAEEIVAGLMTLVARVEESGARAILTTVPPFAGPPDVEGCPGGTAPPSEIREMVRQAVNGSIRDSASRGELETMVDLDEVLRDPADPARFRCGLSDHGLAHPNYVGHRQMAEAFDLDSL